MTLPRSRRVVDTANALKSDVIVLLGDYTATYRFANVRFLTRHGPRNWPGLPRRLGNGRYSATMIGGTTSPMSAVH